MKFLRFNLFLLIEVSVCTVPAAVSSKKPGIGNVLSKIKIFENTTAEDPGQTSNNRNVSALNSNYAETPPPIPDKPNAISAHLRSIKSKYLLTRPDERFSFKNEKSPEQRATTPENLLYCIEVKEPEPMTLGKIEDFGEKNECDDRQECECPKHAFKEFAMRSELPVAVREPPFQCDRSNFGSSGTYIYQNTEHEQCNPGRTENIYENGGLSADNYEYYGAEQRLPFENVEFYDDGIKSLIEKHGEPQKQVEEIINKDGSVTRRLTMTFNNEVCKEVKNPDGSIYYETLTFQEGVYREYTTYKQS